MSDFQDSGTEPQIHVFPGLMLLVFSVILRDACVLRVSPEIMASSWVFSFSAHLFGVFY